MGLILTGEANSVRSVQYFVYIYDQDAGTATDEVTLGACPDIRYSATERDRYYYMMPLSCQVTIEVPSGTNPVRTFVDNFIASTDVRRFWMKVVRDGVEDFRGFIKTDQSTLPIRSTDDFQFVLHASDSLGVLSQYDYWDPDTETVYDGPEAIKDHLVKILTSAGLGDIYTAGERFLTTGANWYEAQMPSLLNDPLSMAYLDHKYWASKTEKVYQSIIFIGGEFEVGEKAVEPGNAGEALQELCIAWNAMIYWARGSYHFVQRNLLRQATAFGVFDYNKTGGSAGSGSVGANITVGSLLVNNTGHYLHTGVYGFIDPIKQVEIDHKLGSQNNLIVGKEWSSKENTPITVTSINNSGDARVVGSFKFRFQIYHVTAPFNVFMYGRFVFYVKIKIGNYWLKRDATMIDADTIEYGNVSWEATSSVVVYISDVVSSSLLPFTVYGELLIDSEEAVPEPGDMEVDVNLVGIGQYTKTSGWILYPLDQPNEGLGYAATTEYRYYWACEENFLKIESEDEENEDGRDFIRYISVANAANDVRERREIAIGDDPGSNSYARLLIHDGADIVDSNKAWTVNGVGTAQPFAALLAQDMALQAIKKDRVISGTFMTTLEWYYPDTRITFDGYKFCPVSYNIDGQMEAIQGSFLEVNLATSDKVTNKTNKYKGIVNSDPTKLIDGIIRRDATVDDTTINGEKRIIVSEGQRQVKSYYVTGITTDRITIPVAVGVLPNPEYNEVETMMRKFNGSKNRAGNMIYRETPAHPSQFSVDYDNNEIVLYESAKATDEYFIMWEEEI